MKKMTNTHKIVKALKSGPKTQADLLRETKVKNVYQIVADLKKKKWVVMDNLKRVNLRFHPVVADETDKVDAKKASEFVHKAVRMRHSASASTEAEKATLPKPEPEIIKTLRDEVENIQDGIRSLMIARTYLLRRIEEEKRNA